jgi:hypothetical protein
MGPANEAGELMARRNRKMAVKAARQRRPKPEGDWAERVAMLKAAIDARKPDGLKVVKAEIARLDSQLTAAVNRRELVAQTEENVQRGMEAEAKATFVARMVTLDQRRDAMPARVTVREQKLQAEIDAIASRVADLRDLIRHLKAEPMAQDEGPTPETAMKPAARDPIVLLHESGKLSDQQVASARTIAETLETIAAAGRMRVSNAESGGGAGGGFREAELPEWMEQAWSKYRRWAARYSAKEALPTLDIVVKVCAYGLPIKALAAKHRMRWEGAITRLQDGLDAYASTKS